MATKSLKIMFLGAPGAGKGTYASRIAPMLQIPMISTGDLVRHEIKTGTSLGAKIKEYNNSGTLVPDQIILDMMEKRLALDRRRRWLAAAVLARQGLARAEGSQHVARWSRIAGCARPAPWALPWSSSRIALSCNPMPG